MGETLDNFDLSESAFSDRRSYRASDAFVADSSADAYERLVDRLLASPHFGERWGRHWLDKARYADSDGYEKDNVRKDAWRYRDWVIQAINDDMPFDQFTIRQLAGDLEPEASALDLLPTAFNRLLLCPLWHSVQTISPPFKL